MSLSATIVPGYQFTAGDDTITLARLNALGSPSITLANFVDSKFLAGNGVPASTLGDDGDYYLNKTTFGLYGPKAAGAWGSAISFANKYTHVQASPTAVWTITHNLDAYPNITVVNSLGNELLGQLDYTSVNALTYSFNTTESGTAYLN